MNWVWHGGSMTFETTLSYCCVAQQGSPCYTAVAQLGFKCHATAVLKSNLIRSIEFSTAVARRFKRALSILPKNTTLWPWPVANPGEARGTCPPPPIFRPKWGPKGWKKFFGDKRNPEPWPLELSPRPANLPLLIKQWSNNLMFTFITKTTYPRDRTPGNWGCVISFIGCLNTFI